MQKFKDMISENTKCKDIKYKAAALVLVIFFRVIFYINTTIGHTFPDSEGYIGFSFRSFLSLKGANGRVPIYPLIIRIFKYIFGEERYLLGVSVLQMIVSLVSVVILYKTVKIVTKNLHIALLVAVIYGACPFIISWDTEILTESLSISGTVIFLYLIVKYIDTSGLKYGVFSILLALLLTFLKPSFLPFNYALLGFWIARCFSMKTERKNSIKLILCSTGAIIILIVYSYIIYINFKVFSISPLPPRHLLAACLGSGIYQKYPDRVLVMKIKEILEINKGSIGYSTTSPVMELLGGNKKTLEFAQDCIKRDLLGYMKWTLYLVIREFNQAFGIYSVSNGSQWFFDFSKDLQTVLFSWLKIAHLYIFGIGEVIATLYLFTKRHIFSWIHCGLAIFILGNVLFVFLGTYAEFGRNLSHLFPFMFLSLAIFLNWFSPKCSFSDNQ